MATNIPSLPHGGPTSVPASGPEPLLAPIPQLIRMRYHARHMHFAAAKAMVLGGAGTGLMTNRVPGLGFGIVLMSGAMCALMSAWLLAGLYRQDQAPQEGMQNHNLVELLPVSVAGLPTDQRANSALEARGL
jgi:hypothetical protein